MLTWLDTFIVLHLPCCTWRAAGSILPIDHKVLPLTDIRPLLGCRHSSF
jgi:hypothetical protein